jgi:hypothetical protein
MKRLIGLGLALVCPIATQAAERPPVCQHSTIPLKSQTPLEDLSGNLPVADYLDGVMSCANLAAPGNPQTSVMGRAMPMPDSAWLEADSARYSDVLTKQKHTWLILPAQTQYMGFDHAERALITAEIVEAFADQGSAPDTTLMARSLGEVRRRFEPGAIAMLTAALGAQRRVETYVGHDGARTLTLTLQLKECEAYGACKLIKQRDWRNLTFSDELPPFRVVNRLRAEMRRELVGKEPRAAAASAARNITFAGMPPAKLFAAAPTPHLMSLLASLSSAHDELSRDRLHVAALHSWLEVPPSADSRFYAAYSALALQRRPYALELLRTQKDAASDVLRELLNGNLSDARLKLPQVKAPVQRMLLGFLIQDLANAYGRESALDDSLAQQVFGDAHGQWRALLERRANDANKWLSGDADALKLLLDALAPIKGLGRTEVRLGSAVAGRRESLESVNFRHLRQAVTMLDGNTMGWQAYWLLEGLAQADVFYSLSKAIGVLAAPDSALALVREYEGWLSGHPAFEAGRMAVIAATAQQASNDEQRRFERAYENAEWSAAYWSQGATRVSRRVLFRGTHTAPFVEAYGRDFPPRAHWFHEFSGFKVSTGPSLLKYSVNVVTDVNPCLSSLAGGAADQLRAELHTRFRGHPAAANFGGPPAPPNPGVDDTDSHIARMRAGIKSDPQEWDNYQGVGGLLIQRRGDYAEAQRVYLSYPLFKTRATQRVVELGNVAYVAGSELYWQGQPDLARPLYQIAADLDTGADSSMTSAARLAQLDGDYETAAEIFLQRGMRYGSAYAFRDYLSLLYVMGHGAEADAGFSQVAEAFQGPQAWHAQLVGQRMNGMTADQLRRWMTSKEISDARNRGQRFAGHYAMISETTDRKPNANTVTLLEEVVRSDVRRLDHSGQVVRPHRMDANSTEVLQRSAFRPVSQPALPKNASVTHEYVLFAQALRALHAGQYKEADDRFLQYVQLYSIEQGETRTAMAYFALAAAKVGDPYKLEQFIEGIDRWNQDYDVWLSRAFFAAVRKDVKQAEQALKRAFYVRPHTELRPVMTEYQYAEACELIGRETGDPRFVRMMVEWARQNQRIQPTQAWSYAVEAQYSTNAVEANRALALTLYLDPLSPRLTGIDEKRKAAARTWLRANNPFLGKGQLTAAL